MFASASRQPRASSWSQTSSTRPASDSSTGIVTSVRQASGTRSISSFKSREGFTHREKPRPMTAPAAFQPSRAQGASSHGDPASAEKPSASSAARDMCRATVLPPVGSGARRLRWAASFPMRLASAARPASS